MKAGPDGGACLGSPQEDSMELNSSRRRIGLGLGVWSLSDRGSMCKGPVARRGMVISGTVRSLPEWQYPR